MISNEGLGSVKTVEKKNGLRKFSGFTQILEIKADASIPVKQISVPSN